LAEVENLIGLREKIFKIFRTTIVVWGGNFSEHWKKKFKFFHTTTLGWGGKFAWPWRKNFAKFSAPQPLAEAENLIGLGEKIFKIFRTTIVASGRKFA
jgi:hypothetical protein